jgi:hypothetical protein
MMSTNPLLSNVAVCDSRAVPRVQATVKRDACPEANESGSQKARVEAGTHTNPGQQGCPGGHCCPCRTQDRAKTVITFEAPVIEAMRVSVAKIVWAPTVFSVAEKPPAPPVSVELAGSIPWASVLEKCNVPE